WRVARDAAWWPGGGEIVRGAAMADLHCTTTSQGAFRPLFAAAAKAAGVLLLCGGLTAYGLPPELGGLVGGLRPVPTVPILAVLGNHEHEASHQAELTRMLGEAGVRVLDGEGCDIDGVGFAGVKGFGGGFTPHMLGFWGETAIKQFVQEAMD